MIREALVGLLAFLLPQISVAADCLSYEETHALSGRLERRVGHPRDDLLLTPTNFELQKAGDSPDARYVLRLDTPICMRAPKGGEDMFRRAMEHVDVLNLSLLRDGYVALKPMLGQRVTLRGMLMGWHFDDGLEPLHMIEIELPATSGVPEPDGSAARP